MDARNLSGQGQDDLAGEVMENVGMPKENVEEVAESQQHEGGGEQEDLPKGVKERLGRQEKRHQKELRALRAQIESLQTRSTPHSSDISSLDQSANPYEASPMEGGIDEHIHRAVSYALNQQKAEQRKAEEAKQAAHVHKSYAELSNHLDNMADKYDDFHEHVFGQDVPFTTHMRDASLFLPKTGPGSAGEVLYKLGKNPDELKRISNLHPLDQASEMVKLSHALMSAADMKGTTQQSRPMGSIKSNPVTNSPSITEKTPVSELRKRMKSGWK